MRGRTTLVIAHRLSTVIDADLIYVIDARPAWSSTAATPSCCARERRLCAALCAAIRRAGRRADPAPRARPRPDDGSLKAAAALGRESVRRAVLAGRALYPPGLLRPDRWRSRAATIPAAFRAAERPFILAFWHGRLLMMPCALAARVPDPHADLRPPRRPHHRRRGAAISASTSIAGSLDRGRRRGAARAWCAQLNGGDCVGITPGRAARAGDAREQRHRRGGAARPARRSCPIAYATAGGASSRSWDRFHLPLPFGRGIFLWGEPIAVPADADDAAMEALPRLIEDAARTRLDRRGRPAHGPRRSTGARHARAATRCRAQTPRRGAGARLSDGSLLALYRGAHRARRAAASRSTSPSACARGKEDRARFAERRGQRRARRGRRAAGLGACRQRRRSGLGAVADRPAAGRAAGALGAGHHRHRDLGAAAGERACRAAAPATNTCRSTVRAMCARSSTIGGPIWRCGSNPNCGPT